MSKVILLTLSTAHSQELFLRKVQPAGYKSLGGDCPGNDLEKSSQSSADDCAVRCEHGSGCAGFSFSQSGSCITKSASCDEAAAGSFEFFQRLAGPTPVYPNDQGCLLPEAKSLPYCDVSLDIESRLDDLMSRLSLEEQIASISPQPHLGSTCATFTAGKEEIGLPPWVWLHETNTAVDSACLAEGKCSTTFVGPLGFGASFNRSSWRLKGSVLATEMRAMSNAAWHRGNMVPMTLTAYGPNINLVRDPRFGRASELPGEDPYLNGHFAKEMVLGMQETDSNGHPKVMAYLKHFTAYSKEANRGHDTYNVSLHDLHESYLAAYKIAFTEANATGAMCSYNALNGVPSCANDYVLNKVLREDWQRPDAHISTDCKAVSNMLGPPANAPSEQHACAWTINNGTDMEMGSTVWTANMSAAVAQGLVDEKTVANSARRAFRVLFRSGRFDPLEDVAWTSIGLDAVNSSLHQSIAVDAALQSFVLLKNEASLLPLARGKSIAVVGPMGVNRNLFSDYANDEFCFGGGKEGLDCVTTIAEAIAAANVGGSTTQAQGVDVNSDDVSGIDDALDLVKAADVAVLVLGNDKTQEHEAIDRPDTALPGQQEAFAEQVLSLGKPTVLVLSNGGAVAIDSLLSGKRENRSFASPAAIVEAFNPSFYSPALASSLFGDENRWGKLPVTMYPHSFAEENPMDNYDMSKAPGRTYKYYEGEPLFPFGHGLSYTTFNLSCEASSQTLPLTLTCELRNTGDRDGDEVVFVYHSAGDDVRSQAKHPVARRALVDFQRASIAKGRSQQLSFILTEEQIQLVDENGKQRTYKGSHKFIVSRGHGEEVTLQVTL